LLRRVLAAAVALLSLGWAGCRDRSCSVDAQKRSVLQLMRDFYFFNGESDQRSKYDGINTALFPDAATLLDELRYRPDTFDRGFSYITTPRIEAQFLDAGVFVGIGIGLTSPNVGELFIREVEPVSPAASAGLMRGDEILEINGRTIAELEADDAIGQALGPARVGVEVELLIQPVGALPGDVVSVTMSKEVITIDVVPDWGIYDVGGEDVGYLLFNSFIPTAVEDLRTAFAEFAAAGVTNVVIDLRYNGGGLLALAESIIDVLGGDGHVGEVQFTARFSSTPPAPVEHVEFIDDPDAFPVERIAFITTARTASASELLINALAPYRDVHVVGDTTLGKPVGQGAADFCGGDYRLRLVAFDLVNADGEGEYYDGIAPTCAAVDDLTHPLGDPDEDSLSKALSVAATGACPLPPAALPALAPPSGVTPAWLGPPAVPWLDVY
jgi:C-terminal peptidase prc